MNTVIEKWGEHFILRIPDTFAEKINLEEKTSAELSVEGDKIVVKSISKQKYMSDALSDKFVSEKAYPDITQTRTWELCGSLKIEKPDPRYIVGYDEQGRIITDYAMEAGVDLLEDSADDFWRETSLFM